jgi:D-glycerate 3-kinase
MVDDLSGWREAFIRAERLPPGFGDIIDTRYVPLSQIIRARRDDRAAPLVVGICGPQGSGKTTGTAVLAQLLDRGGMQVARLSLDDLYLTRAERLCLAARVHPLLATRGVPGTHDVALGIHTLDSLAASGTVHVPTFDKAIDDRVPQSEWPSRDAPADIILFEGWCVGARPQSAEALDPPINRLEVEEDADGRWRRFVNDALAGPYQTLFARIDLLIQFVAPSFAAVIRWRTEQEHKLRDARDGLTVTGDRTMDDAALLRFLQHYQRLTTHIAAEMPARADILLRLGEDRELLGS